MNIFLFDSHSLELHAEALSSQLAKDGGGLFSKALVVISHPSVKEWLQIELCKQSHCQSVMGLQFVGWRRAVQLLTGESYFPSRAEIAVAIWQWLQENPVEEIKYFLASEKKTIELVSELATLFAEYNEYGLPQNVPDTMLWQKKMFEEIFENSLEKACFKESIPLYLFCLDAVPPAVMQFFLRSTQLRLFRFSPCAMFWEDFCSTSERKKLLKKWAQSQQLEALDLLLQDAQPLLANWGKLGRKMLALTPEPNEENYEVPEPLTLLDGLKVDLLLSSQDYKNFPKDESIRCIRTGSSRLQEVRILQRQILQLAESGISFSQMRVYAPDIEIYAPLIEFCFDEIPFRIAGVDVACKNPFYQALLKLFSCVKGRWESDALLSLFEMPVFYRKLGWKTEDVERISQWIEQSGIRWGLDGRHRQEELQTTASAEAGSWQAGFDAMIDSWIFFQPEKENTIGWSEAELFQKFYGIFDSLRKKLHSWRSSRTLRQWGDEVSECIHNYLWVEGDSIAEKEVDQAIELLRRNESTALFPFGFIEKFFFSDVNGEVGDATLHSVRFASMELGAILPARAIFLLGMDEAGFPRASIHSSLRLGLCSPETDRYLFLSVLFAAKERLIFSYGHQSPDDGKLVSPSLLIQELFGYLKNLSEETAPRVDFPSKPTSLLSHSASIPDIESAKEISIQELSRFFKHPLQNYLKQVLGIYLKDEVESAWEDFECSSLARHERLRSFLEQTPKREEVLSLGLFGTAAEKNIEQETVGFIEAMDGWGLDRSSIHSISFDQKILGVSLTGMASLAVPDGALHLGADHIGSVMRRWIEILVILVAKEKTKIFFLKSGKIREVADPLKALESALEIYLRSQRSPLFLHPDWADPLLRKRKSPELEDSKDPILHWALSRSPSYDLPLESATWSPLLQLAFAPLSSLYPTRSIKHAEV